MTVIPNQSLRALNTFGIDATAEYFAEVHSISELQELLNDPKYKKLPRKILGGGSNVLITGDVPGLVILNRIKGIELLDSSLEIALVKAGAGEIWHQLVLWCLDRELAGIENLSLIPGCVGAAPIQNIGAYGVELKETFKELEAVELSSGIIRTFTKEKCRFGYRDSIFKHEAKNQYAIVSVTLQLNKLAAPNTTYGAIKLELAAMHIEHPGIRDVSNAVIRIRQSKLPDPAVIGNAGSFFKNPEVPLEQFQSLKENYPDLVAYPAVSGNMKLAAGWLIEQCGWKGKIEGHVGMHERQALVLVNYGGATGKELIAHAIRVQESVAKKFGVKLEMEVNVF